MVTAIVAIVLAAVLGLAVRYGLAASERRRPSYVSRQVTWREYGIAMAVVTIVVAPFITWLGNELSVDQKLKHFEWYDGVEVAYKAEPKQCYAGHSGRSYSDGTSNCTHTYVSGSYEWTEWHEQCSGSGKDKVCWQVPTTYSADIHTPYATTEYTYRLTNSFHQTYTYPTVYLAEQPKPYGSKPIPGNLPRGAPPDWLEAKQRIDAGNARSVTDLFPYDNYILASEDPDLVPSSGDVEKYLKKKLLPDHTANILENPIMGDSRKQAKKVSFVRVKVQNEQVWQESLMQFNAALGSKLQGDLHVAVVNSNTITDPHGYLKALRAYWLGKHFEKFPLSKNGVILVIGTSGGKIDWAEAATGMPYGNNSTLEAMQNLLVDEKLDPRVIFGEPRTVVTFAKKEGEKDKVDVTLSSPPGALETAMFSKITQFERSCMECEGEEDAGKIGYKDLIAKIEPSFGQKAQMVAWTEGVALLFWLVVAFTSVFEGRQRQTLPRYRSYNPYR